MIQLKRVYDPVEKDGGKRYLVDRVWPRGIKKETHRMSFHATIINPSNNEDAYSPEEINSSAITE